MVRSIGVSGFNARLERRIVVCAHMSVPSDGLPFNFSPLVSEPPSFLYRPFFRLTTFSRDHKRAREFEIYIPPQTNVSFYSLPARRYNRDI